MAEAKPPRGGARRTIVPEKEFAAVYRPWAEAIARAIRPEEPWALVGIKEGGAILARRLRRDLLERPELVRGEPPGYGEVDISLYRDDYHLHSTKPRVLGTEIPFGVEGRQIVLVDDVLYTGRTVRAAIDLILDFGRPRKILLAVLIDRGHRELPIAPDFTGRRITTEPGDQVQVHYRETGGEDGVELIGVPPPSASGGPPPSPAAGGR